MIKISIITVCYNAEKDIRKTLESVLSQNYNDLEYIIVDGYSRDNTIKIIKEYVKKFQTKGIKFSYISEKDKGTYDAMNKGAMMAQGEWINYMNAGDTFYNENSLQSFCSKIDDSYFKEFGVLYGDTYEEYDFGGGICLCKDNEKKNPTMPFCHQSSFIRTVLMQKYKYDLSYKIIADHDLFHRLRKNNVLFKYIPEVVARYNGQYGLSATNPLKLRLEGLRIHGIKDKWYYPVSLFWVYIRYGWIQCFKKNMPRCITDAYMKHKRKYIK